MTPIPSALISSRSKRKEPRYACLSEAKSSHLHKMWPEVSSSVPHFLQMGLLLNPMTYRCLLRVLCPVSRPITALDCVLLKDSNRAPRGQIRARGQFLGLPLRTTGTTPQCQMLFLHPAFHLSSYILCGNPQERFRPHKPLNRATPCKHVGEFISFHPGMTRDPI
jgi:hypothetical protein